MLQTIHGKFVNLKYSRYMLYPILKISQSTTLLQISLDIRFSVCNFNNFQSIRKMGVGLSSNLESCLSWINRAQLNLRVNKEKLPYLVIQHKNNANLLLNPIQNETQY